MVAWLTVSLVTACACVAALVAITRATRELPETLRSLDDFRTHLQPALVRVRDEAAQARARRERSR